MALKTTDYSRDDLNKLWLKVQTTREQSNAIEILKQLHPLILALFAHVDDLQAEVRMIRERVERS